MTDPEPANTEFEVSRAQARKAQIAMNVLVILSSVAASTFLFFVLFQMQPFGSRGGADVEIDTSAVPASVPLLRGTADAGLEVEVADLDEADSYRDKLNETMRKSMGVSVAGRLYRLRVHSSAKEAIEIAAPTLELREKGGLAWKAQWLRGVADRDSATATGKLALDQAVSEYTLAPGESRQLMFFVAGESPAVGGMNGGVFVTRALRVELARDDQKTGAQ